MLTRGLKMELKEKKLDSETIYKGKIIDVYKDKVLCPNGHESYREYVDHCKASCVMAKLPNGKFILEKQYRYPYDEIVLEFPAGKCDENEDPLVTARRELQEETGYKANRMEYLGEIYPTCAYSNEIIYCYFASELESGKQNLDENENLEVYEYSIKELKDLIKKCEIKDAKTIASIAFAEIKGLI